VGQVLSELSRVHREAVGAHMIHVFDSAVCPPADALATLRDQYVLAGGGYVVGAAQHVWTRSEWARLQAARISPLPIWVAPFESRFHEMGAIAGNAALAAMQAFGLTDLVVLDLEAGYEVREDYVVGFYDAVARGSCGLALYGVPEALRQMNAVVSPVFTWVAAPGATWTFLAENSLAWQYSFHQSYDLSVADESLPLARFSWDLAAAS